MVAGKTGTAQMINPATGGYYQSRLVASFVGFLPADDPRLVILVVLDDVNHGHFGGLVAAPVFSAIASGALGRLNIVASHSSYETASLMAFGGEAEADEPPASALEARASADSAAGSGVPSFNGLSLRRAMALARQHHLNLEVKGSGYVVAQEPGPTRSARPSYRQAGSRAGDGASVVGCSFGCGRKRLDAPHEAGQGQSLRLGDLVAGQAVNGIDGDLEAEITRLSYDSRQTQPGDFFFSLARDAAISRAHVEDALSRGARAVAVRGGVGAATRPATTVVECERPRRLMGAAASRFYAAPSERLDLIGITGTSGKTTTAYLLASIFEAAGEPPAIIGTVGAFVAGRRIYSGLTTPESIDFERALSDAERAGARHVAAEVSSIGIEEGRVDQLNFRAAIFTNLGRDHLDYHGTIENYFAAKLRLFTHILPRSRRVPPVAIARGDDPFGQRVLRAVSGEKLSFGFDRSLDVHPISFTTGIDGIRATVSALGRKIEVSSPLLGEIYLLNIMGAIAVSVALGIELAAVVEGVRRCPGPPADWSRYRACPG